jgi:hypothetical protein
MSGRRFMHPPGRGKPKNPELLAQYRACRQADFKRPTRGNKTKRLGKVPSRFQDVLGAVCLSVRRVGIEPTT